MAEQPFYLSLLHSWAKQVAQDPLNVDTSIARRIAQDSLISHALTSEENTMTKL